MPSKYIKLTPEQRAAAYAKRDAGGVASKLAKEKRIKELIDSFIETGDYENFKSELAPSQKKFRLPSGQLRGATAGGRVPPTLLKEITEAFQAGPDSEKFKEIVRISGRDASELIEFSEKIPVKGTIDAKTRAVKAKESFPEWRKKTEAEKAATQAKAKLKRTGNLAYSKAALGSKDFEFLETFNKKKSELNTFFKNDPKKFFNTAFGKNTKDLIDARFKDGKIFYDRRPNSYYQKLIDKGVYSEFDISPARIKKKSLRYPINLNVAPSQFNSAFIEQVDRYFRKNNNPKALNEVSEFLKAKNLRLNIPDVGTIGAEADVAFDTTTGKMPRVEKTLQSMGWEDASVEPAKVKWNNDIGAFETANGNVATQEDLKLYAEENPMEVKVGTEPPKPNKSVLKTVGKTLAHIGAPLPTALIDGYFINKQMDEGKSTAEIAKDPLNWIGLAAMEPLSKVSGIAEKGGMNAVLRLGLNPATIRGISRFAGLPGLAISTAMTAYDQYKKYQNEEGFVYNLFNKEGT